MKQVFTFLKANRYINKQEEHNMGLLKYKGQDVNELRRDFEGAIDDYLALCKANGKLLQSQTHNITPEKV